MFSMVFSNTPIYTYVWTHVTHASSLECWIYVYADSYIYIVAFFHFHCSSLPLKCHWHMRCSYSCLALQLQNQRSHCQNSQQYLCLSCAVFRMKWWHVRAAALLEKARPYAAAASCPYWRKAGLGWAATGWSSLLPLRDWLEDGHINPTPKNQFKRAPIYSHLFLFMQLIFTSHPKRK